MEKKARKFSKEWFENIFWYHYKWHFLIGVFVLAVTVFITAESLATAEDDFTVIIGSTQYTVADKDVEQLLEVVGQSVGDLNGDGKVNIGCLAVNMSDSYDDPSGGFAGVQSQFAGESSYTRMMLYLSQEENSLFLLDKELADQFCAIEFFEDELSDYGITPDADNPYRVDLGQSGVIKGSALEKCGLYGLIIDWTTVGKGSQEVTDAGVKALKAILAS